MKKSRLIFVVFMMFGLQMGCGFHLKGLTNLPESLSALQLSTDAFKEPETAQLRQLLNQSGAKIIEAASAPSLAVKLSPINERVIASNATQSLRVFSISRSLSYRLLDADGALLLARELNQSQELELDTDNLLQLEQGKAEAVREINQALFGQMLDQLKN